MPTLRQIIKINTGQDIQLCQACMDCDMSCPQELDVPIGSMIQMAIFNDNEVLTCRTLWSDCVLENARYACKRGLNVQEIMLALREEAKRKDLV